MAKKKKDLLSQSILELQQKADAVEKEIFELRNELAVQRKLERPHMLKAKRHERARILTVLTHKSRSR